LNHLHIVFGRKTHIRSRPKTKPEIPNVEVVGWGNKELSKKKWYVFGGLEKSFSPIKTRSARKMIKEKEQMRNLILQVSEGPRALRAHKSLAIGIK